MGMDKPSLSQLVFYGIEIRASHDLAEDLRARWTALIAKAPDFISAAPPTLGDPRPQRVFSDGAEPGSGEVISFNPPITGRLFLWLLLQLVDDDTDPKVLQALIFPPLMDAVSNLASELHTVLEADEKRVICSSDSEGGCTAHSAGDPVCWRTKIGHVVPSSSVTEAEKSIISAVDSATKAFRAVGSDIGVYQGDLKLDEAPVEQLSPAVEATYVRLCFVINGEDWPLNVDVSQPLSIARDLALKETHNTGRPPEEFEMRNERGEYMDPRSSAAAYGIEKFQRLYLSIKVGAGGAWPKPFTPKRIWTETASDTIEQAWKRFEIPGSAHVREILGDNDYGNIEFRNWIDSHGEKNDRLTTTWIKRRPPLKRVRVVVVKGGEMYIEEEQGDPSDD